MTPDAVCIAALDAGFVTVDPVRGLAFSRRHNPDLPLGTLDQRGYLVCTLHYEGVRQQVKLHRLVWISVHGPIPPGMMMDHVNRVKHDNRIANLRLADATLNAANRRSYAGEANPASRITRSTADAIRDSHGVARSYDKVARQFHVSRSLVAQIVRGELWCNQ